MIPKSPERTTTVRNETGEEYTAIFQGSANGSTLKIFNQESLVLEIGMMYLYDMLSEHARNLGNLDLSRMAGLDRRVHQLLKLDCTLCNNCEKFEETIKFYKTLK